MPNIKILDLTKRFISDRGEDYLALDRLNLDIPNKKYTTLLGPSGCGKTTLLRLIAGLIEPTSGQILFDNEDVSKKMTQDRDIGFMFQNFAIFPHMDVWHNTAFGPVVRGWSREEIDKTVKRNLKLVGLKGWEKAMPHELSGGMSQRLGLARALAGHSSLLLLDEPLSALDAKISAFLRFELKKIAKASHLTAIHVTHNQEEAMTISDNIVLMRKGEIVQSGTPEDLYDRPNSMFTANFIGKCNFFKANKKSAHSVEIDGKTLRLPDPVEHDKLVIGIRPEKIHLDSHPEQIKFTGRIELINFLGHLYEYRIDVEGNIIKAYKRIKGKNLKQRFHEGDEIEFSFSGEDVFIFPEPKDFKKELSLG